METWQYIVTLCAGIITLITFFDKIGVTKSVKKVDADFKELKGLIEQVSKTTVILPPGLMMIVEFRRIFMKLTRLWAETAKKQSGGRKKKRGKS